jgi:release factor glutamine methyltransferase
LVSSSHAEGTVSWRQLLIEAEQRLRQAGHDDLSAVEARHIVERASGYSAAELVLSRDQAVTTRQMAFYDALVERRLSGEPLQYVLGSWGFRRLDLFLDRRVLIPRPETETVAEVALREFDRVLRAYERRTGVVVDLGTGSGAIALSFALERVGAQVWATDVSPDALDVARANCAALGRPATRVTMVEGDWFAALPHTLRGTVDVIVSNPPYVAAHEPLPPEVAEWEPTTALVPGPSGLEAYEQILGEAGEWLANGGSVVFEIGSSQREAVRELAHSAGFADVEGHPDLTGRDRVIVARRFAGR